MWGVLFQIFFLLALVFHKEVNLDLLFIIFMNDLITSLKDFLGLLYANAFKLFKLIQTEKDWEKLQEDPNSIMAWSDSKRMNMNIAECSVVTFTYRVKLITTKSLIRNNNIKDLGVVFKLTLISICILII